MRCLHFILLRAQGIPGRDGAVTNRIRRRTDKGEKEFVGSVWCCKTSTSGFTLSNLDVHCQCDSVGDLLIVRPDLCSHFQFSGMVEE